MHVNSDFPRFSFSDVSRHFSWLLTQSNNPYAHSQAVRLLNDLSLGSSADEAFCFLHCFREAVKAKGILKEDIRFDALMAMENNLDSLAASSGKEMFISKKAVFNALEEAASFEFLRDNFHTGDVVERVQVLKVLRARVNFLAPVYPLLDQIKGIKIKRSEYDSLWEKAWEETVAVADDALDDVDSNVRAAAVELLIALPVAPDDNPLASLDILNLAMEKIQDEDPIVRGYVLALVSKQIKNKVFSSSFGSQVSTAVAGAEIPHVLPLLKDNDLAVRRRAGGVVYTMLGHVSKGSSLHQKADGVLAQFHEDNSLYVLSGVPAVDLARFYLVKPAQQITSDLSRRYAAEIDKTKKVLALSGDTVRRAVDRVWPPSKLLSKKPEASNDLKSEEKPHI